MSRRFVARIIVGVIALSMCATVAVAYELSDPAHADRSHDIEVVSEQPRVPARIEIPRIGIEVPVQSVGRTKTGAMSSPSNFYEAGWYRDGTRPGEIGSAVIAGHLDNALGISGVFKDLNELSVGDVVNVYDALGEREEFSVVRIAEYSYDDAPLSEIFGRADGVYLNLITCAGEWLRHEQTYSKRLVVYTRRSIALSAEGER